MKRFALSSLTALVGCLPLFACGGKESTDPGQTLPPSVASVVVTPASATLVSLGETVQLTASARDANGNTISGKTFTWASSNESIATVSSSGLVTAIANGAATITATTEGVQGSASLTVAQVASRVEVTPASAMLVFLGETVQLTADARDANGNPIPGKTFAWSSSDAGVVAVTSSGLVTAVANGSVTITATADGVEGTAAVDVDQPGVKLAFVMAPSDGQAGTVITPPVQVSIQDALDNVVTSAVPPIMVELGTNSTGATLAGATTVNAVAGVASFDDLVIDKAGPGYTLIATSGALVSATSAPFSACLAPPSGMVGWWPGDGNALDLAGGNDGTPQGGATFAPGKVKQAFSFSNGAVTLQSQPPVSQGFTIDAWVNFEGTNFDGYQAIFNNNQVFLRKNGFEEGNKFAVFVKLAGGRVERAQSTTTAVPGVFYHVAATWDGTTLKLYMDGQLEGTRTAFPGPLTSTTVLAQIGRGEQTELLVLPFFGLIDEFTIFDRALSATNVRAIFNAGSAGKCGG